MSSAKLNHALGRRRDVESSERFGHTDQYAADQGAGHGAEAADDHNHESEKRVRGAEAGRQVDEHDHHTAGDPAARRTEAESERVKPLHVEADDFGTEPVVGAGADRRAGIG